jgi:hypothetical protein
MRVISSGTAEPDGVGVMQFYDGWEYWGEWRRGHPQGWGVQRTMDGESEFRGEFSRGQYCGLGLLREGAASKWGRWIDGALCVRQRLSASALFAARDAAIRAGKKMHWQPLSETNSCLHPGYAAARSFPDEGRAAAEAVISVILAGVEAQCSALERCGKQLTTNRLHLSESGTNDDDLMLIRNVGDEPEFEYWGFSLTQSFLNEDTHKLVKKTLPHGSGRKTSVEFGWLYRGQFESGNFHGMGGVVWDRLDLIDGELRKVSETYIGQWHQGRREGLGVFMRSDGTSDQGMWINNNLAKEFILDIHWLLKFQAAVNHGEAAATKAEARANATKPKSANGIFTIKHTKGNTFHGDANDDGVEIAPDPYSTEYMARLMELLISNSQERDAAHMARTREYEAACKQAEVEKQQDAAAFQAHSAALAYKSDSDDDDGTVFCTLGTSFFAGRIYYGDSPVNVGIEFDQNSRPSIVKEVFTLHTYLCSVPHHSSICSFLRILIASPTDLVACGSRLEAKAIVRLLFIRANSNAV